MKPSIKSAMKDRMPGKPGNRVADDVDRAYVQALGYGRVPDDPRVGPSATFDWLSGMPE
jgi:hypothetical protein